ncbi:hypothetical protein TNCV_1641621 [Trichonephila clavipes]|nr:hypothetical protein TNCV_1641621 [Trichonephila clavipes]
MVQGFPVLLLFQCKLKRNLTDGIAFGPSEPDLERIENQTSVREVKLETDLFKRGTIEKGRMERYHL